MADTDEQPPTDMETLTELMKKGEIKPGEMVTVELEGMTLIEGVLATDSQQNAVIKQNSTVHSSPSTFVKSVSGVKSNKELSSRHLRVGGRTPSDLLLLNSINSNSSNSSPSSPRRTTAATGKSSMSQSTNKQQELASSDSSSKLSLPSPSSVAGTPTLYISPSVIRQTNINNSRNHSRNHSRNSSASSNVKLRNCGYNQEEEDDRDILLIKIKIKFQRLTEENKKKQERITQLETSIEESEDARAELSKRTNSLKTQYEQLQETLNDRDEEITKLRKDRDVLMGATNSSEGVEKLNKLIKERNDLLEEKEEQLEEREEENMRLQKEIKRLKLEKEEIGMENDSINQEKGQYRKSVEIKDYFLKEKMNEIIQMKLDLNRSKVGYEKEISNRDVKINTLEAQLKQNDAALEQERDQNQSAQIDIAEREAIIRELRQDLDFYKSKGKFTLSKRTLTREKSITSSPNGNLTTTTTTASRSPSPTHGRSPSITTNGLNLSRSSSKQAIPRAPSNSVLSRDSSHAVLSRLPSGSNSVSLPTSPEGSSSGGGRAGGSGYPQELDHPPLVTVDSFSSVGSNGHTEDIISPSAGRSKHSKAQNITSPSGRSFKDRLKIFARLGSSPEKKERAAMRKAKSSEKSPEQPARFRKSASTPDASAFIMAELGLKDESMANKRKSRGLQVSSILKKFQTQPPA